MVCRLLLGLLVCGWVICSMAVAGMAQAGEVVYRLDLGRVEVQRRVLPVGGAWEKGGEGTAFRISVPAERAEGASAVSFPVDLRPWRGMQLSLACMAKAQGVTRPAHPWLGAKCMLHFKTPTGEQWVNENDVFGTFDWKPLSCAVTVPEDAGEGEISLGLQGSSGTAWFRDVRLVMMRVKPVRPVLPAEDAVLPTPFKGHDLPRLRGVMSPNQFNEQDFADLAKWNVNAIRWQMGRNWGVAGTDRDQAEYDRWLDGKLDELAKVLEAGRRYGIRVMVDLHGPPGGREKDNTLTMVLEKKYQNQFVRNWQKIAKRFGGHPALWAYDLVNEPVQNRPSPEGVKDWLGVQVAAAKAIREVDPKTAISIEVDGWDGPDNYAWMAPVDVPNVIYQVHMYWPGEFTHQFVFNDWGEKGNAGLVTYPGMIGGQMVDKETLRRKLQPVREFQRAYNVHIVVGEFSAIRWAPGAERYLADCTDLFEEYGWDWTYHAFREWLGWSVEHAEMPVDRARHMKATETTARAKVLLKWFAQNQHEAKK